MANTTKAENHEPQVVIPIPVTSPTHEESPLMGSAHLQNNSYPPPEVSKFSPNSSSRRPPTYPVPSPESPSTRRKSFKGKPKSRFGQPSVAIDSHIESLASPCLDDHGFEPEVPFVQPKVAAKGKEEEKKKEKLAPDEKEIYKRVTAQLSARNTRRMTVKLVLQLLVFLLILAGLVCSLTVESYKGRTFLGVEVWKWFVILMVTFSGLLVIHWVVHFIVFLIEWKFMLRKNVVYFTHGLKTSVKVVIWFSVVLGTWVLLFRPDIKKTKSNKNVINFITWTLVSLLIGSFLWLLKTTLIKMLASSFRLNRFFDRIQEAVFHHYVLQALSGPPVVELARKVNREDSLSGNVSFTEHSGSHKENKVVDWSKLHQMRQDKVPSWTMDLLVNVVSNSGLSTVSGLLTKNMVEGGVELDDDEITDEEEAIATAYRIFNNLVKDKDNQKYITRADLLRFMIWEELRVVYPEFEVNEEGQISLKAFSKWVVKIFNDRQALQHALNDNKTAVDEFNRLLIGILIVLMIILWLVLTNIASTKLVLFFSSQLLVAAFIFGNTCKTIFEAIIFVFVMHPFDVSDRCVIDGTMMVVEEMNILTTVFLKPDKEKVYYPNSVLATKAIGNFYRSPDQGDTLDFSIDYSTPLSTIAELKERIKQYLEQTPNKWHPDHVVAIREIENINKIKVSLIVNHTMNFQDFAEKLRRKSELVLELKSIFDELGIRYHLLPQEVHLRNMTSNN